MSNWPDEVEALPASPTSPELTDNGDGTWTIKHGPDWVHTFTTDEIKEILEPYPSQSDEQLRKLANDLFHGTIFCSLQIREPNIATMIFAVAMFGDDAFHAKLAIHKIKFIYEYMSKAMPRGINGYPMFMSMAILNNEDADKVIEMHSELLKREGEEASQ